MPEVSFVTSALHQMPAWQLTSFLGASMLAAASIGYRIGKPRHERIGDGGRGHFNAIQASLLGLLALLLGFTFNMANVRFDARRQGVIDAANNFAALGLRSEELPGPACAEFKALLRESLSLQAISPAQQKAITPADLSTRAARYQELHRKMWEILRLQAGSPNPPKVTESLAGLLTEAQALLRRRVYSYLNRVPDPILYLLYLAAIGAAAVIGFSAGLVQQRGRFQICAMIVFVCGTIHVILDLDRPISGVRVDQSPLLELQAQWEQEAKTK